MSPERIESFVRAQFEPLQYIAFFGVFLIFALAEARVPRDPASPERTRRWPANWILTTANVVLTSALLVTPAAAASLLTNRLPRMMLIAALIAVGSGLVGLYASYYFNVASGASIVLACTACFGLAWVVRVLRERK